MSPPEFVKLSEAMPVDNLLQPAVGIVANTAVVVENHHLAISGGIGLPGGKSLDVGIAGGGELSPCAAHEVGQREVFLAG